MNKKLLVAYDGSEPSENAFAVGLDLAVKYRAELLVLAVARPPEPADDVETEAILESAQEHYEELFAPLMKQAAAAGVTAVFKVVAGHPADQIVRHAEEFGADQIIVGHRGKTLFQKWLVGSVAKRVLSYASCTVTVVR